MNKCFKCHKDFPNVDTLCDHIKNDHGLRGKNDFVCMKCGFLFGDFSVFKNHLKNCSRVPLEHLQDDAELEENQQMTEFKAALKNDALIMALEIMADMNFARSAGFKMLSIFRKYLERLIDGFKLLVGPIAVPENEHIIEDFIAVIESSFSGVSTEDQLHRTLVKNDLLCSLKKYVILTDNCENEGVDDDDDDGEEEDNNGEELEADEGEMVFRERARFSLSPMHFEIKKFFELPNVFEQVMRNTATIQLHPRYSHFINGNLWKKKLESFHNGDIVIPYHLYMDGAQQNNALGTHAAAGSVHFSYYIFPTTPAQYQSRLENKQTFPNVWKLF